MNIKDIRWGAAIGGMVVAQLAQIAAAFAWVAIYSYVIHPGETADFYQRYAQVAAPWVSLLAGTPIFYLVCRWIGSRVQSAQAWPTAMALFALFVVIDLALTLAVTLSPRILAFAAVSYLFKLVACHLGGRGAARNEVAVPA